MVQIKVYYGTSGDVQWYRLKCTIERLSITDLSTPTIQR